MTQLHPVTVTILDKEYHIGCPAAERANLESAARFLDQKMREVRDAGKVFGIERIAVLTALNMSYDMLQSQPGNSGQERVPRVHASDLLERIDRELHGEDPALRRQKLQQQAQAGQNVQHHGRPQVEAPTPAPAVEMPAAAEPAPLPVEEVKQQAPWEQQAPMQEPVPAPQVEQDEWALPPDTFAPEQESQDQWQDPAFPQQNPPQLPGQNQWTHQEEKPSGEGYLDSGPDFQLPPQQN